MPEISQEDALRDVRDAYRIVHAYQRRILDTMNLVGDAFPEASFYYWDCLNYNHPPQRSSDIRKVWAWDALPMHGFSVFLTREMPESYRVKPGGWMLELSALADDAFESEGEGEPDATSFAGSDQAGTKFDLVMWRYDGNNQEKQSTWHGEWSSHDYPDEEGVATTMADDMTAMMRSYDLATLNSVEAVNKAAADFRRECREVLKLVLPDLPEIA